jgi:hypothetical protein
MQRSAHPSKHWQSLRVFGGVGCCDCRSFAARVRVIGVSGSKLQGSTHRRADIRENKCRHAVLFRALVFTLLCKHCTEDLASCRQDDLVRVQSLPVLAENKVYVAASACFVSAGVVVG